MKGLVYKGPRDVPIRPELARKDGQPEKQRNAMTPFSFAPFTKETAVRLRRALIFAVFTIALGTTAIAEGSGPGGSDGGMEGGAASATEGGENGAEIRHPENTGSGIVRGNTDMGSPNAHSNGTKPAANSSQKKQ